MVVLTVPWRYGEGGWWDYHTYRIWENEGRGSTSRDIVLITKIRTKCHKNQNIFRMKRKFSYTTVWHFMTRPVKFPLFAFNNGYNRCSVIGSFTSGQWQHRVNTRCQWCSLESGPNAVKERLCIKGGENTSLSFVIAPRTCQTTLEYSPFNTRSRPFQFSRISF